MLTSALVATGSASKKVDVLCRKIVPKGRCINTTDLSYGFSSAVQCCVYVVEDWNTHTLYQICQIGMTSLQVFVLSEIL